MHSKEKKNRIWLAFCLFTVVFLLLLNELMGNLESSYIESSYIYIYIYIYIYRERERTSIFTTLVGACKTPTHFNVACAAPFSI